MPALRRSLLSIVTLLLVAGCSEDSAPTLERLTPPVPLLAWGESGTGPGQFNGPRGLAIDSAGNVYVADGYNHRIQKFDADGRWLAMWGSEGSADGRFEGTWAVIVGADDRIYVADRNNHRIQEFDADGRFLRAWGSWGTSPGLFSHPRGLALDTDGNLYTLEGHFSTDSNRVQKFDHDGHLLGAWGSFGHAPGQFDFTVGPEEEMGEGHGAPGGLAPQGGRGCSGVLGILLDSDGNAVVSDLGNDRIQVFNRAGKLLRTWGHPGLHEGELTYPQAIATDRDGHYYVVDGKPSHLIQIFDHEGRYLTSFGGEGTGPGQFSAQPMGMAIGPDGSIYVADTGLARIIKFAPPVTSAD